MVSMISILFFVAFVLVYSINTAAADCKCVSYAAILVKFAKCKNFRMTISGPK